MKDTFTDLASFREKFGIEPPQMIDTMGLSGDASDNIPGVPGIGPKTALTLIKTFGTMDDLYRAVDTITKKKQHENLVTFKDQAYLSRDLVTIRTDAPVRFEPRAFKRAEPDAKALSALFKELEFQELHRTFSEAAPADAPPKSYTAILSQDALDSLAERLAGSRRFGAGYRDHGPRSHAGRTRRHFRRHEGRRGLLHPRGTPIPGRTAAAVPGDGA